VQSPPVARIFVGFPTNLETDVLAAARANKLSASPGAGAHNGESDYGAHRMASEFLKYLSCLIVASPEYVRMWHVEDVGDKPTGSLFYEIRS
jgi:hypothetical protein